MAGLGCLVVTVQGQRDQVGRRKFLEALAEGKNPTEACKIAGISRRTPGMWAKRGDSEVEQALLNRSALGGKRYERGKVLEVQASLEPASPEDARRRELALQALEEIATSSGADERDRVAAAKALLDATGKAAAKKALAKPLQPERPVAPPSPEEAAKRFRVVGS